jgi:hypothetical protein
MDTQRVTDFTTAPCLDDDGVTTGACAGLTLPEYTRRFPGGFSFPEWVLGRRLRGLRVGGPSQSIGPRW